MRWFWYFLFYSFAGFLLEVAFARLTGEHPRRKCMLVFPLCPVYGLGACAILAAAGDQSAPLPLFLLGGALATVCEYAAAFFYQAVMGVSFWDYHDLPWNLHGRVCLPFSLAWGLLAIPLVRWLHPVVAGVDFAPPLPVTALMLTAFLADTLLSAALLRQTGTRDALDWYL